MLTTLVRFADLKSKGIVSSWAQLANLQRHYGFPIGRKLGGSIRVWTLEEVEFWLANRPTEKLQPRGIARPEKRAERDAQLIAEATNLTKGAA